MRLDEIERYGIDEYHPIFKYNSKIKEIIIKKNGLFHWIIIIKFYS